MSKHAEDLSRVISDIFKVYLGSANPKQLDALQKSTTELTSVLEGTAQQGATVICKRLQDATSSGFEKVFEHFTVVETEIKRIDGLDRLEVLEADVKQLKEDVANYLSPISVLARRQAE